MRGVHGSVFQYLAHVAVHELEQLRHHACLGLVDAHRPEDLRDELGVAGQVGRPGDFVQRLHVGVAMVVVVVMSMMAVVVMAVRMG